MKFFIYSLRVTKKRGAMGRILRSVLIICFLSSCSFDGFKKPIDYDNACSILDNKRYYYRAFRNTNRKWGVPIHVQMAVIYYESSFQNRAKTPMRYFLGIIPLGRESSAFGYAQALDGTWADYKKATGRSIARRSSIRDSADFMGWYMTKTRKLTGVSLSDAKNQYLAYHEGQVGYLKGSYKRKKWLIKQADNVGNRSLKYKRQLESCIRT